MKGEETYSPAEASRVLGRSGRKSEEGDRLIAELEEERAERRHLAEHREAEQRRGFWSRLFGREVARRFGRYRGYADFHAGGNFVLTEFYEVQRFLCALEHIHDPQTGVCCVCYVAS